MGLHVTPFIAIGLGPESCSFQKGLQLGLQMVHQTERERERENTRGQGGEKVFQRRLFGDGNCGKYHGPPKPTFWEVFMVTNLVFRWPKPLFFMVWGLMVVKHKRFFGGCIPQSHTKQIKFTKSRMLRVFPASTFKILDAMFKKYYHSQLSTPLCFKSSKIWKKTSCFVYPRPPWKVFTTFKVGCMFLLVENLRKAYDSEGERLVGHQWFTRYFVILNEELFGSPESFKITGWCLVMSKMSKTWPSSEQMSMWVGG